MANITKIVKLFVSHEEMQLVNSIVYEIKLTLQDKILQVSKSPQARFRLKTLLLVNKILNFQLICLQQQSH